MSTDHPNGGSFLAYPQIIQLLMDRTYREDMLKLVHPTVLERSTLKDLTREYSLYEICIITRSGPARILGLANKGHLGPGADADITIYTPNDDKRVMFELPRVVIKSGVVIVEQGEIREPANGKLLYVAPEWDVSIETDLAAWFEKYYSVRFRNYPIPLDYLHEPEEVACSANADTPLQRQHVGPGRSRRPDAIRRPWSAGLGDRTVRDLQWQPETATRGVLRRQR
jgi:formylmethanofuran dehydrogenase subunit A